MYATTVIYEIHACAQDQWHSVATFNDPNAAVAEAVRLRTSRRYRGIRVIEAFHEAADKIAGRVLYRYTATDANVAASGGQSQDQIVKATQPSSDASMTRPKAGARPWSVGRFLPRLSIVIAALLVLMTFSAA